MFPFYSSAREYPSIDGMDVELKVASNIVAVS